MLLSSTTELVTLNATSEHVVAEIGVVTTGSESTVIVTVNASPWQLPIVPVGVTVYTIVAGEPLILWISSAITPLPEVVIPVAVPEVKEATQAKLLATEFPVFWSSTYTWGSKLNGSSLHTVSFAGAETGVGLTVIINDSVPPVHVKLNGFGDKG